MYRAHSFRQKCGNPDFRSIFGHQRAKNEGTNTKIDRGPETYPISINPWDEMNRADSFCKNCGNPDFRSIFGHQRAKNAGTNTKIDRGPETYPISINPRDEMNWANSFREKLRKPCLQTDGRTDGRTDGQTSGWIQYTPFPPSVERGYNHHNKPDIGKPLYLFKSQTLKWYKTFMLQSTTKNTYYPQCDGCKHYLLLGNPGPISGGLVYITKPLITEDMIDGKLIPSGLN